MKKLMLLVIVMTAVSASKHEPFDELVEPFSAIIQDFQTDIPSAPLLPRVVFLSPQETRLVDFFDMVTQPPVQEKK